MQIISKLILNALNYSKTYDFTGKYYVYGQNNRGKTSLVKVIDWMLGSKSIRIEEISGMKNINSIEMQLQVKQSQLFLKRDSKNLYYKYAANEEFVTTTRENYNNEIAVLYSFNEIKSVVEYNNVYEEKLTFRALTFLNFINENGLGDLTTIFTKAREPKYYVRVKNVMTAIFYSELISKIAKLSKEISDVKNKLHNLENKKMIVEVKRNQINRLLEELSLDSTGTLDQIRKDFLEFKTKFNRTSKNNINYDLAYLLKANLKLSEEIKIYEQSKIEAKKIQKENSKNMELYNFFKEIASQNEDYNEYLNDITIELSRLTKYNDFLSIKDYDKSLEVLKEKKCELEKMIEKLDNRLNMNSYEDTIKAINVLEHMFNELKSEDSFDEINELINLKNQKEKELIELKNKLYGIKFDDVNAYLNDYYRQLEKYSQLTSVKEDINKQGFRLFFDPLRISVKSYEIIDGKEVIYTPGSLARHTSWQICAYLATFKFVMSQKDHLPLFPVLIADSINQPYDAESFPVIHKFLREKCDELGIQLIHISSQEPSAMELNDGDFIDISSGLNPAYDS